MDFQTFEDLVLKSRKHVYVLIGPGWSELTLIYKERLARKAQNEGGADFVYIEKTTSPEVVSYLGLESESMILEYRNGLERCRETDLFSQLALN